MSMKHMSKRINTDSHSSVTTDRGSNNSWQLFFRLDYNNFGYIVAS